VPGRGGRIGSSTFPGYLLGLHAAPKEEAGVSSAEVALGVDLQLPWQPLPGDRPYVMRTDPPQPIPNTTRTFADVVAGRVGAQREEFV